MASPANRMADRDVSRCPLTAMASAPASHRPFTTICRSLEKTFPSSVPVPVRGLPSALLLSLPAALSRVRTTPLPVTASDPDTRLSVSSRAWSAACWPPSASFCSRSMSACIERRVASWRSEAARRVSICDTRSDFALAAAVEGARSARAPNVSSRPTTADATTTTGVPNPVLAGSPAATRRSAAAAYPGSSGRSIIEVSSVMDSSTRRPVGVGGGASERCEVGTTTPPYRAGTARWATATCRAWTMYMTPATQYRTVPHQANAHPIGRAQWAKALWPSPSSSSGKA